MRVLFFGSPSFAVPVVDTLHRAGHEIVGVVTRPDRPAGRGRQATPTPVKVWAAALPVPVLQPASLRGPEAQAEIAALAPDVIVVAAYGRILPRPVLDLPPRGCLNLHPSLLPRHRGPSPVVAALLEDDRRTGVTVMLMDAGMDSGPVLAQEEEPILPNDTAETLTDRLFQSGARLMDRTLTLWARGEIAPRPQDDALATYSTMLSKEDGELSFSLPAARLAAQVRAYLPWPGTYTHWRGRALRLLEASALPAGAGVPDIGAPVGSVVRPASEDAPAMAIVAGDGLLGVVRLQLEGRRPATASEFLRGHPSIVGEVLPS